MPVKAAETPTETRMPTILFARTVELTEILAKSTLDPEFENVFARCVSIYF